MRNTKMKFNMKMFAILFACVTMFTSCGSSSDTTVPKYTIGGTVSGLTGSGLVLQNNGSDDIEIPADGDFTFDTELADSAAYAVTVSEQPSDPSQTCTISNGSGTVNGADVTNVTIECTTNTYTIGGTVSGLEGTGLVLQNNAGDDLGITANGDFTFSTAISSGVTYAVTVLTQPRVLSQECTVANDTGTVSNSNITNVTVTCVTPPPRFAYVANNNSDNVSAYTIDAATGALTPITGSPFAAGSHPASVAVDPTGQFAYVGNNNSSNVSAYTIDTATGALTQITGSPFAAGPHPYSIAVDPTGKFAYVANYNASNVSAYTIDAATGALTPITGSPFAAGTSPASISISR